MCRRADELVVVVVVPGSVAESCTVAGTWRRPQARSTTFRPYGSLRCRKLDALAACPSTPFSAGPVPSTTSPRGSPTEGSTGHEHLGHRHRQPDPQPAAVPHRRRHPVVNLTLAENARRLVEGEWVDGPTTYWQVACFGAQAEHVIASLHRGARAIAVGTFRTRTWTTAEGEDRSALEIIAEEIGASLRWATTDVTRATTG